MSDKLNEWVDATTYSRGQKERIQTAWQYNTDSLSVYITFGHREYPGKWVVVCYNIGMNKAILKMPASVSPSQTEIKTAQSHAIEIVKRQLQKMIGSLNIL